MKGFNRLFIVLTPLMLLCVEVLPCRCQPAASPGSSAPSLQPIPPPDQPADPPPPAPAPAAPPAASRAPEGPTSLKPAPLEVSDLPLPITLASALRLADARPLIVAAAQASAWSAEAALQRAQVFWVPQLYLAAIYYRHDGNGPDFNRGATTEFNPLSTRIPISQNLNWFYGGGGLNAMGSPVDAIFLPLAARQVYNSSRWNIQAAKNDALLQTAQAYFNVHRYRGIYAGTLDTVERGQKLVRAIEEYSREFVPAAEVNRARRLLADLQQRAVSAREQWRTASADLTQVLRLDPRVVVVPLEHDHLQVTLIDPARPIDSLIETGLLNRPELASQQALVQAALIRIRQEKLRPLIPSVLITGFQTPNGMRQQVGIFGTGPDSSMNQWSFRDDFSAQLVWQLDGLGLGNLARIKKQRALQSQAVVDLFRIQDAVAADITQTQARMQSAAARVLQAERTVSESLTTFDRNLRGLAQTIRPGTNILVQTYRPQEAVVALERLQIAYTEYFSTVADYNISQFQLFHALGYPAREVADFQPPGDPVPVDTNRPGYLPTVGIGPPPATR